MGIGATRGYEKLIHLLILIFLLWFMGWRLNVGCDFFGYASRYEGIFPWDSPLNALEKNEPGFEIIVSILKANGFQYLWVNVVSSAIMLLCYYRYFRISQKPLAEIALLFPVIILQLSMSGLRQGIAVAMLTAACAEFVRGKRMGTAVWIVLAAQFHASAVVFLPLAALAGRPVSMRKLIGAIAILTPLAAYLMGEQFDDYTDQYVRQIYGDSSSAGALPRYLLVLVPSLYFWRYHREFSELMPRWSPLFQVFSLGAIFIAPLFLVSSMIVHRMSFYFMPVSIMIAANAYRVIDERSKKYLLKIMPFFLYGIYMIVWLSISGHAERCYIPYQSYSF
ncbi:MAG TPA: EpsG family protein [Sphingomonadaceae bacterium]|nr:EpsG family protein [Sphingomonadaceae bacterium]